MQVLVISVVANRFFGGRYFLVKRSDSRANFSLATRIGRGARSTGSHVASLVQSCHLELDSSLACQHACRVVAVAVGSVTVVAGQGIVAVLGLSGICSCSSGHRRQDCPSEDNPCLQLDGEAEKEGAWVSAEAEVCDAGQKTAYGGAKAAVAEEATYHQRYNCRTEFAACQTWESWQYQANPAAFALGEVLDAWSERATVPSCSVVESGVGTLAEPSCVTVDGPWSGGDRSLLPYSAEVNAFVVARSVHQSYHLQPHSVQVKAALHEDVSSNHQDKWSEWSAVE